MPHRSVRKEPAHRIGHDASMPIPGSAKSKPLKRMARGVSTAFGLFYEPDLEETIMSDIAEVLRDNSGRARSPTKARLNEINARVYFTESALALMDANKSHDSAGRIRILEKGGVLLDMAERSVHNSDVDQGAKDGLKRLIKGHRAMIEAELRLADAQMLADEIRDPNSILTKHEKELVSQIEECGTCSREGLLYIKAKRKIKRKLMIDYALKSLAVFGASIGTWIAGGAALFSHGMTEDVHALSGALLALAVHQGHRFYKEAAKSVAASRSLERTVNGGVATGIAEVEGPGAQPRPATVVLSLSDGDGHNAGNQ